MNATEHYEQTRRRFVDLVGTLDPNLAIPACPGWTVHDVLAHVVGLAADVASGNVDGYATDEWTAQQVAKRSDQSIAALIEEWDSVHPAFEQVMGDLAGSDLPELIRTPIGELPKATFESAFHVDLLQHEHDVLGANGTPRTTALDADVHVMSTQIANVRLRFAFDQMPTLRIAPTGIDRVWNVGTGDAVAELSASPVDLLRSFGGRRAMSEIAELRWSGDWDGMSERLVLPFFSAPPTPLQGG